MWGEGPLGLTLRPDLGEDMPPVVGRITRINSAAAIAKVAEGHMLVSINGVDTARKGYDHVVDMLQKVARPATLRFRVPRGYTPLPRPSPGPSSAPDALPSTNDPSTLRRSTSSIPYANPRSKREQYTIVWTEGPLGMILRPDDDDCHIPCIRKITGKGVGTGMDKANVGDVLVAVNGQETKTLGFRRTISLLKTIRKPAVLKFKRMRRRISRKRSSREDALSDVLHLNQVSKDFGAYDVVWREGELGLKLKPGSQEVPIISRLTGKGTASGLHNANVGDELVSVNGSVVEGEAYQDTLRMLKHSQKPAILRFRPGKNRRESMLSVVSVRSNPATATEVEKVRTRHVPIYDTGREPTESPIVKPPPIRKKKRRIPLQVAKELVAAAQDVDINQAVFAGFLVGQVQDGTREAHILRVEAKKMILAEAEARRNGIPAKYALTRAERQAKVLQDALDKIKNQAKKYEEILKAQEREKILASAMQDKSEELIGKQNSVIAELSHVISRYKRDSYSEMEINAIPSEEDPQFVRQSLIEGLQEVMNIPVVVPQSKYCAECGATEMETKLDLDEDGQFYCTDCWAKYMSRPMDAVHEELSIKSVPDAISESEIVDEEGGDSVDSAKVGVPPYNVKERLEKKQMEEANARIEAEQKLLEIKQLRQSGSLTKLMERGEDVDSEEKARRDLLGLEELANALREEENRARMDGNEVLADKLNAQRTHILTGTPSTSPSREKQANASLSDEFQVTHNAPREPQILEESQECREFEESEELQEEEIKHERTTNGTNGSSDSEGDDRFSEGDDDMVRDLRQNNVALARQLEEAHSMVERARMSILMTGDDTAEDDSYELSNEQIQLFKKLTSQADERMSMVDRLHPPDSSDSDSDSDEQSEAEGVWI